MRVESAELTEKCHTVILSHLIIDMLMRPAHVKNRFHHQSMPFLYKHILYLCSISLWAIVGISGRSGLVVSGLTGV